MSGQRVEIPKLPKGQHVDYLELDLIQFQCLWCNQIFLSCDQSTPLIDRLAINPLVRCLRRERAVPDRRVETRSSPWSALSAAAKEYDYVKLPSEDVQLSEWLRS